MYNGKWNHCSGSGACGHCNLSVQPSGSRVTAASPLRRGIPCEQTVSLVGRGKWAACMAHVRRIHHIKFSSREGPTLFWRINKHPPVGRVGRKRDYFETAEGNMLRLEAWMFSWMTWQPTQSGCKEKALNKSVIVNRVCFLGFPQFYQPWPQHLFQMWKLSKWLLVINKYITNHLLAFISPCSCIRYGSCKNRN